MQKTNHINIHFIIGSGRSGTTLLLHILNKHKNCISTPEWKHLLLFYNKYHSMTEVTPDLLYDLKQYSNIIELSDDMAEYYGDTSQKFNIPVKLGEKLNYIELCFRIYFLFSDNKPNISTVFDKNPLYTLHVDKLSSILPNAKFLCTVRDYRGFVLSNIQSIGYSTKRMPVQYHALVWLFYNKLVLDITAKYTKKTYTLRYEDFVVEQEKYFLEICTFFNIESDINALNYQSDIQPKKEATALHERIAKRMIDLSKPINTERVQAWKNTLSNSQLKTIEFWCAKTGEKFGYLTTQKINLFEKIKILFISLPYYTRVFIYFKLKSVKINFYLNDVKRAKYFSIYKNKK